MMRFVFDISHPAHVHFFRHIVQGLEGHGHATWVVARDKDVTLDLLDAYGIAHKSVGTSGRKGRLKQIAELVGRDIALWRIARRFGADVIVTRNPSGVQAARLAGVIGVFDTDDGRAAGVHFKAAAPFAHYITTPACLTEDFGPRHVRYRGLKQSAYLHPDHFTPDPAVLSRVGLAPGDAFFIVRFVEMSASHDNNQAGMRSDVRLEIVRRLQRRGPTFISWEGAPDPALADCRLPFAPHEIHHALAFSRLYVGDSQTMAAEAAMLGTPALRMSSFTGKLDYLSHLETAYGLVSSFTPNQQEAFFDRLEKLLGSADVRQSLAADHQRMLHDMENVARWYVRFLESLSRSATGANPVT